MVDLETQEEPATRSRRKCCFGCCVITTIFLLVLILTLVFTVFKQKSPNVKVESLALQNVTVGYQDLIQLEVNVTVDTDVTIHNLNSVPFKNVNSTTMLYYRGQLISISPIAYGEIGAERSVQLKLQTFITITGESKEANESLDYDIFSTGVLPLVIRVAVMGAVKFSISRLKHLHASTECSIKYSFVSGTETLDCNS